MKSIGASLAGLALVATSFTSQAADMPRKAAPASYTAAYYNWTGSYVGVNVGYGSGTSTWSLLPATTIKPKGMLAGGTLGYNWQAGSIVYGLEGDFDWSDVKGNVACVPGVLVCETSSSWLATFRGRIGYAFDRWLPYITGGGAYGNVKATLSAPAVPGAILSSSNNQLGWTVGAGLEYAIAGNWTVKLEYLYVDLGSFDAGIAPVVNNVSFKENIVRGGLNYKFSGPTY